MEKETRLADSFFIFLNKMKNNESLLVLVEEVTTKNKEFLRIISKGKVKADAAESFISSYLTRRKVQAARNRKETLAMIHSLEGMILKTAIEQGIINLSSAYEEFLRRVILKYYEDDLTRLGSKRMTLSNQKIVDALKLGHSIHRLLAEEFVGKRSVSKAENSVRRILGRDFCSDPLLYELRLIRNALVHNGGKATPELAQLDRKRFRPNHLFRITTNDFLVYKDSVFRTAQSIQQKFNEKYPEKGTDWQAEYFARLEENQEL